MVNTYFVEGCAKVAVQSASWISVFKGKIEDPEVEMYQLLLVGGETRACP